ncbi:ester hydrolase C11orf54 homolog isoform X2 [Nematostella vectensis]|nr:ester hydrolase C11orf54 homolog isoform X2 [Nematostella vectensis]
MSSRSTSNEKELSKFPVEDVDLYVPPLDELAKVLQDGLTKNFSHATVTVVECPDFRQPPWNFPATGFGGKPRIVDVGGPAYLLPLPQLNKIYDMNDVAAKADLPGGYVIGAGAGSHTSVGVNCEMIANVCTGTETSNPVIQSKITKVNPEDGSCVFQDYDVCDFSLLANCLITEGKPGKVLKVEASKRTGDENFVTCMRLALGSYYGNRAVGIGGTFMIAKGKANFHIMPEFSKTPLNSPEEVNNWLKFYDMSAPLVCLGVLESYDPGLDLRVEHFHGYNNHGEGGHYHYDTTPNEVEYVGYFTPAERLYRMDRPPKL